MGLNTFLVKLFSCFHSTYCGWLNFSNLKTGVDLFVAANVSFSIVYVFLAVPLRWVNTTTCSKERYHLDRDLTRTAGRFRVPVTMPGGTEKKVGNRRGNRENDITIDPWHGVAWAVGWVFLPHWRHFFKDAGRSGKIRNWPCSTFHQSAEPSMDGGMKVTSQSTKQWRNWHDGMVSIFQQKDTLESIVTMQNWPRTDAGEKREGPGAACGETDSGFLNLCAF